MAVIQCPQCGAAYRWLLPAGRPRTGPWRARAFRIKNLRAQGLTLESIGAAEGISRERVRQILKKRWVQQLGPQALTSQFSCEQCGYSPA